jgi:hypothetical protein
LNRETVSRGWLFLSVAVILAATLTPQPGSSNLAQGFFAPPLRDSFASDLIQNVLLYLPLGVIQALRQRSAFRTTSHAAILSLATELCQFAVPGRDPVATDLAINTIGAVGGWAVASIRPAPIHTFLLSLQRWLTQARRPDRHAAARLSITWAIVVCVVVTVTSWLLSPALPEPFYFLVGTPIMDAATRPVRIGSDGRFGVFRGLIDEVRIYASARSQDEIRADMGMPVSASTRSHDLVAAYGFDSSEPDKALDAATGLKAVLHGTSWTESGRFGGALVFDGRTSEVVTPLIPKLELRRAMTIEAWVNPSERQRGSSTIVADDDGAFAIHASNAELARAPVVVGKFGQNRLEARARTRLPANTWTHLAAVYDGRVVALFVNAQPLVRLRYWSTHYPLRISLDHLVLMPGLVASPTMVRSLLSGDFVLALTLRCGRLEKEQAPAFSLVGVQSLNVFNVDASGEELRIGWLSQGRRIGLVPVDYRVPRGLSECAPGRTLSVVVKGPFQSLRVEDADGRALPGQRPGISSAWCFLFDSRLLPVWLVQLISYGYLALLVIPFGFWARGSRRTMLGILLLGGVILVVPQRFGMLLPATGEIVSLTIGGFLGAIVRVRLLVSGS